MANWKCWSFILTRFVQNNSRKSRIHEEGERQGEREEGKQLVPGSEAIGAHCCWTYLIIAFHFVLGKRRKLNANLHDTNSSWGAWARREGTWQRQRQQSYQHQRENNKGSNISSNSNSKRRTLFDAALSRCHRTAPQSPLPPVQHVGCQSF